MTIEELRQAFQDKTTIQQEVIFSSLVGKNIVIEASIIDIESNEIKFEFISNFERMESIGQSVPVGYLHLKYNKEKFGQELITYKNGDDVKINATLIGWKVHHALNKFDLELASISKYKSTRQDRVNERQKKYHNHSPCFIATVCYGNYNAPQVLILRQFRDSELLKTKSGRMFVAIYYHLSPPFARLINKSERLKYYLRILFLDPIISKILKSNSKSVDK